MAIDERQRIAHLLRRAGFGASRQDLEHFADLGFEGSVNHLLDPEAVEEGTVELPLDVLEGQDPYKRGVLQARWLYRVANSSRPLAEKMAYFWQDHFATSQQKVKNPTLMWKQYETLRDHGLGSFEDLALEVSRDPAMLIWLDNVRSRKEAPNENYGREFLELFTLGFGNYTEDDVKAASAAFTGWSIEFEDGAEAGDDNLAADMRRANSELTEEERQEIKKKRLTADANFIFRSNWHDNGEKTFLGQTGPWNGEDIVRIATSDPAAASFITTKLFAFFIWDAPDPATVEPFTAVFLSTGGDIRETVRAMLLSDEFSSEQAYRNKIKSPVEMVAGLIRDLGTDALDPQALQSLVVLGQVPFLPPHVGGWPSGTAWIGPSTLLERFNLPYRLISNNPELNRSPAQQSIDWTRQLGIEAEMSTELVVDTIIDSLLYGDVQEHERNNLLLYAQQSDISGASLTGEPSDAARAALAGLVRLTASVPTYQLN